MVGQKAGLTAIAHSSTFCLLYSNSVYQSERNVKDTIRKKERKKKKNQKIAESP